MPNQTSETSGDSSSASAGASRLGILGCGAAAEAFVLPVIAELPQASDRVVLIDLDLDRAEKIARAWGLRHTARQFEDSPFSLDAGLVTTPHGSHVPLSLDLLENGCHVFVEKPLSDSASEASRAIELAESRGLHLVVNNCRRLFPSYQEVHRIARSGELGGIREIRIEDGSPFLWESASNFYLDHNGPGVLLDRGAHTVDIVSWWLGGRPQVLSAERDGCGGPDALFRLELTLGEARISLRFSRLYKLENEFTVEFEKGTVSGGLFDSGRAKIREPGGTRRFRPAEPALKYDAYAREHVRRFVQRVDGVEDVVGRPMVEAADVLDSIAVLEDAYAKSRYVEAPWYSEDPNIRDWRAGR